MARQRKDVKGKGKGRAVDSEAALESILNAAIQRAKSPALREWLMALASDRADRTTSSPAGQAKY